MRVLSSLLYFALVAAAVPVDVATDAKPYALRILSAVEGLNGKYLSMNEASAIGLFEPEGESQEPFRVLKIDGLRNDTFAMRHYPSGVPNGFLALVGDHGLPQLKNQVDPNRVIPEEEVFLWKEWTVSEGGNLLHYANDKRHAWVILPDGILRRYNGIVSSPLSYIEIEVEVVPYPDPR